MQWCRDPVSLSPQTLSILHWHLEVLLASSYMLQLHSVVRDRPYFLVISASGFCVCLTAKCILLIQSVLHLNPAVTIGFLAAGKIPALRALAYIIFQCLGSCTASALVLAVTTSHLERRPRCTVLCM